LCFCVVFLHLVYPMLPVSLGCIVFCFVFLRLVYPMLTVSLGCVVFLCCFSSSCVPYVVSFSGFDFLFLITPSVFSNAYSSSGINLQFIPDYRVLTITYYRPAVFHNVLLSTVLFFLLFQNIL
jgi:hypothetical protein